MTFKCVARRWLSRAQRHLFFGCSDRRVADTTEASLALQPELFFTFSDPSDVICPTPWNMLGMAIGNQHLLKEENDEYDGSDNDASPALH